MANRLGDILDTTRIMIETSRLILRPIRPEDSHAVFEYRSDALTNRFQGWIPTSVKEVEDFIVKNPKNINDPGSWYQMSVIMKTSNELIGDVGIHFMDADNFQCEIGCTLNKEFHSQGYAEEALSATIDHLFKKLHKHRIIASIDPENKPAIKLVERLGMRKEGHFKESLFIGGKWFDDITYAILAREWKT
jgi:RimJ/RimL family protein N-acetyltransferase